ncbi:MAG TPA: hypothetical protein VMU41_17200 [Candidatus Binataceae bacterium]|nr:hypothetical protein [Candidatus Binataceae bacterium]
MKWLPFGEILVFVGVGCLAACRFDVVIANSLLDDFLIGLACLVAGLAISLRQR